MKLLIVFCGINFKSFFFFQLCLYSKLSSELLYFLTYSILSLANISAFLLYFWLKIDFRTLHVLDHPLLTGPATRGKFSFIRKSSTILLLTHFRNKSWIITFGFFKALNVRLREGLPLVPALTDLEYVALVSYFSLLINISREKYFEFHLKVRLFQQLTNNYRNFVTLLFR